MSQTQQNFSLDDVLRAGAQLAHIHDNVGLLGSELLKLSLSHDPYLKSTGLKRIIKSAESYKREAEGVVSPYQDSAVAQDYLKGIYQRANKILEKARFEDYWVYR